MSLTDQIDAELSQARQATSPGRARVCARRAAALAIRAYYQRRDGPRWGGDAMQQLARLQADPAAPEPVRQAAARLTTRVDAEHRLPFDADPVEDALTIVRFVSA